MDQKGKLDALVKDFRSHGITINVELLKGGIQPIERKRIAQSNPHILAINPELLSWILLREAQPWTQFFSNLKYVVIDEVHTYRGILGMHMAGIIRRLLLQARKLTTEPQFILSSATVSNPMDLASRLTSLPESSFDLLVEKDDGSRQAHKHWVVANPDLHVGGYDGYLTTVALVMIELLNAKDKNGKPSPLNTIVFAKSKRDVHKIYKLVQENLRNQPDLLKKVTKYTSSDLDITEKQRIYESLKTGQLLGVVSTNALEAGIDIGRLDACIIAGFPFTVMAMRQMAGRVGRQAEGLVVFVPHPVGSVDQYYRQNPELLLSQPPEVFVVDPENAYIARKHINAAAYSLRGVTAKDLSIFGPKVVDTIRQALIDKVMNSSPNGYTGSLRDYRDPTDIYAISSIRAQAQIPYTICLAEAGQCNFSSACLSSNGVKKCESQIAVLDRQYAYRDCHPGAIYESMDGGLYRVVKFDDKQRVIRVVPLPDNSLERTFVEEETYVNLINNRPVQRKTLHDGVEVFTGEISVTRTFTGYYTYELTPSRRCNKCRRDFDDQVNNCPVCKRKTIRVFGQTKVKHADFTEPFKDTGLKIRSKTVGCWVKFPSELEERLSAASTCKLPGEQNKVMGFLKNPLDLNQLGLHIRLSGEEKALIKTYYEESGQKIRERTPVRGETLLYPGVYGQCILGRLRKKLPESRALEVYQAVTGYPVTDDLKHICRDCQSSALFSAMHTLEHTVLMRYPSVALGDSSDLGSYTTLGHFETGGPTIFWYDNYEGGLGAAEKIYDVLSNLLEASEKTLTSCKCNTLGGCPICTQIGHCDYHNEGLNKPGSLALIAFLLGKTYQVPFEPFVYKDRQKEKFASSYKANEYAQYERGVGEEAPKRPTELDPYQVLRLQKAVHDQVLEKAFEIRAIEIGNDAPPISAVELNRAFQAIKKTQRPITWNISVETDPYRVLEVLPSASLPMAQKIYRVIALNIHPDTYPGEKKRATEMMQILNDAFDKIRKDKIQNSQL